jgi:hypothetical protein
MTKRVLSYLRFVAVLVAALAALRAFDAADAAAPTNDPFTNPQQVTQPLPYTNTQDTSESTLEQPLLPPEPLHCGLTSHSVWYSFTPNQDGTVKITTFGSDYDTTVSVYTGADITQLLLIGCEDDTGSAGTINQSAVNFTVIRNTTYLIQVGSVEVTAGTLTIDVFWGNPPFNNNRGNALNASPPYTNTQDTTVATDEPSEPNNCGERTSYNNNLWLELRHGSGSVQNSGFGPGAVRV